jgi:uncharacterized metal-binding protein YceD (DUF177 family)
LRKSLAVKIHLNQIPAEGLHLSGEEDCPLGDIKTSEIRCLGPMRYSLDLGVSDGALWANGTIAQTVELSCVACLEKFEHEIRVPAFALHTELRGPETVDITPFMREDILLNLLPYPHCDRDGGRVCKAAKLAEAEKSGETKASAVKREHDWGELDKLKLKR